MIISFSSLGRHGRLGNQLFQVASTLGLSEMYGAEAAFPEWSYARFFETAIPYGEMQEHRIEEQHFHHYDWDITGDCDLRGYLQSEKYFGSTRLKFKDEFLQEVKAKHAQLFEKPTICVQIRRGDYVGNSNYHQLTVNWYIDAFTRFVKWREHNILFVSDDIEYCKVHFECMPNAYFSVGQTDIEDMALASCCDHFIISNSSFGWWCAWLGEKPHSKIIHCGCLHSGKLSKNGNQDYYPERWTKNSSEGWEKIPLKDVTFTIPVYFDNLDRKVNLELSLHMLQSAFDTNFIICEQGSKKFGYMSQWAKYVRSDLPNFHRTKMLNEMCNLAETPFIANWDADIIIPPMQVLIAVEELRAGAEMVFPYDGRFARMPRNVWLSKLHKHHDIGVVGAEPFKGREPDHYSVGGAVMWNKEAFVEGGMENEYFISFGPEDVERFDRFTLLGYDIRRVKGSLFHMNHFIGANSSSRNPHFKANHRELDKIHRMTAEQLREYIDTWKWRNPYTSRYYRRISEGAIRSAKIVMEALLAISDQPSAISSVIDVGCGLGEWHNGNPNYFGLDYRVREKELLIPPERFIEMDLEKEFYVSERKYDLCLCLEVAEHISESRAAGLVKMLCSLSDKVLFSAAIPFQGGTGHINEQWQTYWEGLFIQNGFGACGIQPAAHRDVQDNPDVEIWYRNNMVLYQRGHTTAIIRDLILPEYYMQIVGHLRRLSESHTSIEDR